MKQKIFLDKLKETYGSEPLPSFDRICSALNLKSKNSVWQYFKKLIENGYLNERENRFFLSQKTLGIPYFESGVRAGFPSPAEDYGEEQISFDNMLVKNQSSTFCVRISGDSMINAGICEDDIAVVEKGINPKNGDIVVAVVDGEFTVKFYRKDKGEVYLEPANDKYPIIKAREELQIFGTVTGIVRKYV